MSALKDERDMRAVQGARLSPLIDCGRASQRTCGVPYLVWLELGVPPNDTMLFP